MAQGMGSHVRDRTRAVGTSLSASGLSLAAFDDASGRGGGGQKHVALNGGQPLPAAGPATREKRTLPPPSEPGRGPRTRGALG